MDNIEDVAVPTVPVPRLRNYILYGIHLFQQRYNSEHQEYMQEVSKTMIWTVLACAMGFLLQCFQMVQLKTIPSLVLSVTSMLLTYYELINSNPASRQLQCFGLFCGFLLENLVKSYCYALGSSYWQIFLKGFIAYGMLVMSALFASSGADRPLWTSLFGNLHVLSFLMTSWPSLLRRPVIGVLVLMLHLASCFFTIKFNMRNLLYLMREGHTNRVLCAMIMFVDLLSLMTNTLIASAIRTSVTNRSSEMEAKEIDLTL